MEMSSVPTCGANISVPPNPCTLPPNHEGSSHRNASGMEWGRTCTETGPSLLDGAPLHCIKVAGHDLPHEDWAGCTWTRTWEEQHPPRHKAEAEQLLPDHLWEQATNAERRARGEAILNPTGPAWHGQRRAGHRNLDREQRIQATIDAANATNAREGEGHLNLQTSKQYDPSPENFSARDLSFRLGYGPQFWLAVALAVTWTFVAVSALALLLVSEQLAVVVSVALVVTAAGFCVGMLLFLLLGRVTDG